jgi:hypothetical protein
MAEDIINKYLEVTKSLKIYIYDFYPAEFRSLIEFIERTVANRNYDWGETYKSWLYFMHFLVHSPMYTTDPSIADFFLVPQWENLYKGQNFYNHLIMPLKAATQSEHFKNTTTRNHIFIYISDDTPLYDKRIPLDLRIHLQNRFIRITYSGRITGFGKYHNSNNTESIFNFNAAHEIVVPPGIPVNYYKKEEPNHLCKNDITYKGTLSPPKNMVERSDFLKYISSNFEIGEADAYFGVHCAGHGIWTARLYNYLITGVIPILCSDGVILPFERFLNYRAFSVKVLSSTYDKNEQSFVDSIKHACSQARKTSSLYKMQKCAKEASEWLDWKSTTPYRNPFTLIILELYDRLMNRDITLSDPIAKEEFFTFDAHVPLYKSLN